MGGEWHTARLGDLCDFRAGAVFKPELQGRASGEYPFVKVSDMNLPANAVRIRDANNWVSRGDLAELRAKPFPLGTVVFAKIGEALRQNRLRQVVRETLIDNNMMGAIPRVDRVDAHYLYYALSQFNFSEIAQGTALPYLTVASLAALEVVVPPPAEQRAIAHILGTLDDKIDNLRRQSETLEAMARALFRAWFVDFEPVRAKRNLPSPSGRGAGGEGRHHPKLPAETLAFARKLRAGLTDAERLLWRLLRDRQLGGFKFRRQHPVPPYVLDFYCHEARLAVEVDGGQHAESGERRRDARRTEYLQAQGIRVLRFWADEVLRETEAVLEQIWQVCVEAVGVASESPLLSPLPSPSPLAPLPEGEGNLGRVPFLRAEGHLGWQWPQHILDLFPDRLVDSELGEIPEGWAYRPVSEFAELKGGKQLEKEKIAPSGPIPVFGGAGVMGYTDIHNADGFVIAVGRVGAYCGQFFSHRGKAWINNNASLIKQTDDDLAEWLFLSLSHADIDVIKKGAAQPFVSNGDIAKLPLMWPTEALVHAFTDIVGPMRKKNDQLDSESRTLAQLRDTLLPKLISGELRVKDAEAFLRQRGL